WRLATQGRCQRKPQAPCVMIISFLLRQPTPRDRRKQDSAFRKVGDMKGVFTLRVSPQPSPRASTSPPPLRDGFFEVSSRREPTSDPRAYTPGVAAAPRPPAIFQCIGACLIPPTKLDRARSM